MMANFDDFSVSGAMGGVLPQYPTVPTDVRNTRSFLLTRSELPKFYYDLKAQSRHHSLRRARAGTQSQ